MAGRRVVVLPSSAELGPVLARLVTSRAEKAIVSQGRFTLGLSGGSLVSMLSKELLALPDLDCSKWVAAFCDERLVPFDDPESTYGLYKVPDQERVCLHACVRVTFVLLQLKCNPCVCFPESLVFQGQHPRQWDPNHRLLPAGG